MMATNKLEESMKQMEGMQMPLEMNGENWWPERHYDALITRERNEARREELERVLDNIHSGTLEPAVRKRLAELSNLKESS